MVGARLLEVYQTQTFHLEDFHVGRLQRLARGTVVRSVSRWVYS